MTIALLILCAAILAGTLYLARRYAAGGICYSRAKLDGKAVIITGANTGIGKETAVDLARRGARVILACRSAEKGEETVVEVRARSGNDKVVFRRLDLASLESVRQFASSILEEEPTIDILINNAGVSCCPYSKTEDGFEMQFGVNHLAHFLLTNLLLDRLKEAPTARIVNVSSIAHRHVKGINFDDLNSEKSYSPLVAYGQSKLANILFTRSLAKRLAGTSVITNCLHPGVIRTEIFRHVVSGTIAKAMSSALSPDCSNAKGNAAGGLTRVLKRLNDLWRFLFQVKCIYSPWRGSIWCCTELVLCSLASPLTFVLMKSPREGAQTTIYCAVDEAVEGVSGKYFKDCKVTAPNTKAAVDDDMAERLWKVSAELVGL
eukprot:Em0011g96a